MELRRLLVAALIATSGFVVGAAATGMQDEGQAGAFLVPAIHVGDQGQYNLTANGEERTVRFLFSDTATWFHEDGEAFAALRLLVEDNGSAPGLQAHWLDAATMEPIMSRQVFGGGGGGIGLGVGPVDYWRYTGYAAFRSTWDPEGPWCGLVHGLQGGTSDDATPLRAAGACPSSTFHVMGPSVVHGRSTRVYESEDGTVRLHVAEGLPVPLRIEHGVATWDLVLFGRGDAPAATDVDENDAPPIEDAPYRHGPALGAFDHPFPLDDAVDLASQLPANPLSQFFASHPDAYVAAASYVEDFEPGSRTRAWTVVASDGIDATAVRIIQDGGDVAGTTAALPLGTGLALPGSPVPRIEAAPEPPGPFPDPVSLPANLPTVASMVARWEAHARAEDVLDGADAYGFRFACGDDCSQATWFAWAGINRTQAQRPDELPEPPACVLVCADSVPVWIASQLTVDLDGLSVGMVETDWVFFEGAGYDFAEPTVSVEGGRISEDPKRGERELAATIWTWPSAPVAAGLSVVSLLLAALYYFWPAVKAAPLALFSRVRQDQALDHPLRQRLMDAIASEPGIHLSALVRRSGRQAGVVRHHLDILEAKGLATSRRAGGYRCYFPRRTGRDAMAAAHAVRSTTARRLLIATRSTPGITMQQAAATTGITPSAATHHVRRLHAVGLVERRRDGRTVRLFPGAAGG